MFAWKHLNMLGISPKVSSQKLNISLVAWPILPNAFIWIDKRLSDVANLLEVEFIYEVEYPDWQTNVVLPNKGGK